MQTRQIVFTAPYIAEFLDAPCLPALADEVTALIGAHTLARPKIEHRPGYGRIWMI